MSNRSAFENIIFFQAVNQIMTNRFVYIGERNHPNTRHKLAYSLYLIYQPTKDRTRFRLSIKNQIIDL